MEALGVDSRSTLEGSAYALTARLRFSSATRWRFCCGAGVVEVGSSIPGFLAVSTRPRSAKHGLRRKWRRKRRRFADQDWMELLFWDKNEIKGNMKWRNNGGGRKEMSSAIGDSDNEQFPRFGRPASWQTLCLHPTGVTPGRDFHPLGILGNYSKNRIYI